MIKFTIAIPAYKRTFLKEAIDSCLVQTYKDFELVIVNDASPEDLDSIMSAYNDTRIRYYKNKKNCGAINVVDNWNRCLEYVKGDYVICMGDDDRLRVNCLEEYKLLYNKYPGINVFHGRTTQIDEQGREIQITEDRAEWESVFTLILHRLQGRPQYIGDFFIKREFLKNVGGYYKLPYAWGSDDIISFMAAKDGGIAFGDTPEEIQHAISTREELIRRLDFSKRNEENVEKFIHIITEKFGKIQ